MRNTILRFMVVVLGVITTGLGVWVLANPSTVLITISSMLIALIFTIGVVSILTYIINMKSGRKTSISKLLIGCVDISLSMLLLNDFAAFTLSLPIVIAIWVIIRGILSFIISIDLKVIIGTNWIWLAMMSIFMIISGYIGFVNPVISTLGITYIVSIQILFTGIELICEGLFLEN